MLLLSLSRSDWTRDMIFLGNNLHKESRRPFERQLSFWALYLERTSGISPLIPFDNASLDGSGVQDTMSLGSCLKLFFFVSHPYSHFGKRWTGRVLC